MFTGGRSTPLYPRGLDRGEGHDTQPKLSRDDDAEARRRYIRIIQWLQKQYDRRGTQFYGNPRKYQFEDQHQLSEYVKSSINIFAFEYCEKYLIYLYVYE